jgi:Bacterial protein of unknown function (DUF894).
MRYARLRLSMPSGLKVTFRSLKYKNFRLYFSGQSMSLIGTWIQRIATPWLVYRITGSTFLLGVVGFAGQIPTFLLAPFAGVLVDRWNRYHILVATQILAMLQAFALAILFFMGIIQIWEIIALSIVLGLINAFDSPARQSLLVLMVGKKEDLGNAIALNSTMVNAARLLGPSIAGVLIATTGEGTCFFLNGLSYLFVIVSLLFMTIDLSKLEQRKGNVFKSLKDGFNYTFGFAPIKYIILLLALVSFMGMPYTVLMPVFAKEILHGGAHTFGFLMGASGVGALTGAIFLASRRSVLGLGRIIPAAAIIFGVGLVSFAYSRFLFLSMALMVVVGLGMMLQMAASNTIIQTIVDDDKRGRVMSFYAMAFMGTAPFGSFFAGSMATMFNVPITIMVGGVACIIGGLVFARQLGKLKTMVRPIYIKLGILSELGSE